MTEISTFLANPIVGLVGYILSMLSSIFAVIQFVAKRKAASERDQLKIEITKLTNQTISSSSDEISQGKKSQYFKDNSGSVSIDNRG